VEQGWTWGTHGGGERCLQALVGSHEGKRSLGRITWEDNIKMDIREIRNNGASWIQLAQNKLQWQAFVNTEMNLRIP